MERTEGRGGCKAKGEEKQNVTKGVAVKRGCNVMAVCACKGKQKRREAKRSPRNAGSHCPTFGVGAPLGVCEPSGGGEEKRNEANVFLMHINRRSCSRVKQRSPQSLFAKRSSLLAPPRPVVRGMQFFASKGLQCFLVWGFLLAECNKNLYSLSYS